MTAVNLQSLALIADRKFLFHSLIKIRLIELLILLTLANYQSTELNKSLNFLAFCMVLPSTKKSESKS